MGNQVVWIFETCTQKTEAHYLQPKAYHHVHCLCILKTSSAIRSALTDLETIFGTLGTLLTLCQRMQSGKCAETTHYSLMNGSLRGSGNV